MILSLTPLKYLTTNANVISHLADVNIKLFILNVLKYLTMIHAK